MKIGWVRDFTLAERPGGAQVCEDLLRKAVPQSVELVECPPGSVQDDVDAYILLRCQRYSVEEVSKIILKPCLHWAMDYWEWGNLEQKQLVYTKIKTILFGSPLHKAVFLKKSGGIGNHAELLPYPVDVEKWLGVRKHSNGRSGAMWFGEFHPYKAPDMAARWATDNKVILDMYGIGIGPAETTNPFVRVIGTLTDEQLQLALASHQYFVHFPRIPEGFPYSLMEAWLAGLEVLYSGRIGLDSWDMSWNDLAVKCAETPIRFWELAERCL